MANKWPPPGKGDRKLPVSLALERDDDGYPTEDSLSRLAEAPCLNNEEFVQIMDQIREVWWHPDYFTKLVDRNGRTHYMVSTGGWSGNEDLIGAMQRNTLLWMLHFQSVHSGGHYHFSSREVRQ